jgi:tRNA-2-methylthio-N6-dimethylallyladenosine synthase
MNGRYLVRTFGCQMNEHDSERIAGMLEGEGLAPARDGWNADVVVLNTCAVRENADNRLYGTLGVLKPEKERHPGMRIVVAGCLAQKDRGEIQRRAPWVDVVVGTHALPGLVELIRRAGSEGPQMDVREYTEVFPSALPAKREVRHHAWVSVSVGCDNHCSFCIVPLVRGRQRSRPLGEILAEVQGLVSQGVVEVTLLGQNVNTYGRDVYFGDTSPSRKPLFAELLRAVNGVDGIRRIRFTSPHPHDFTPDVIDVMATCEKVCEHIHFPLQSGSDRVLGLMRRSYRSARYLEWLERIREAVPSIAVTTDIIVGFPGETERDFLETLGVVEEARFDAAYTFQYSPRAGTDAAGYEDQVPKDVVQERFERLVEVQERISLERNRALEGRVEEVLVEGIGRKGGAQGRTRSNKVVNFESDAPPGEFLDVRIARAHPHHLIGEPAEVAVSA